jgi:hypothetical protein
MHRGVAAKLAPVHAGGTDFEKSWELDSDVSMRLLMRIARQVSGECRTCLV